MDRVAYHSGTSAEPADVSSARIQSSYCRLASHT